MTEITGFLPPSEKQQELERLRKQASLLETAESVASIGHWEWDYRKGCLVSCSDGFSRIYGMSIDQVIESQNTWEKMLSQIHPEDRESYADAFKASSRANTHEIEYRIQLQDGNIRYVCETGIIQRDDSDYPVMSFVLLQDITDRVVYEQELENREALARQVEAITDIGHFIFNLKSETYHYISDGFARIHGVSVEEYTSMVSSREDDIEDVHPEDHERLSEVYRQHEQEGVDFNVDYRIFRADGSIRWIREQGTAVRDHNQELTQSIGVVQDITEQKAVEQNLRDARDSLEAIVKKRTRKLVNTVKQLESEIQEREKIAAELAFLANHDALTGLPSLRLCKDRLDQSLADARRTRQLSAVMFLDLDGFKNINDTHSHEFGDLVLKATADRITAEIRETDTVARIGGDEFVIILSGVPDLSVVERIATNLVRQIAADIRIEQHVVSVSGSIGIALYPDNGITAEELIRAADKEMYRIKESGKNSFGFATAAERQSNFS